MKKILFFISVVFITLNSEGQEIPEIIPPSPNATSLGEYAEIPVSYYTGVANIQIPIYTIQQDGFELPVSLSYHASGIKVEQEASQVGLGWALNAGGIITRNIQGLDDLGEFGYPVTPDINSFEDIPEVLNSCLYGNTVRYCNTENDTEPDIFYFNFANKTGKFILNKKVNGEYVVQLLTPLPLKFEYTGENWIVTDENGIKYYFEVKEKTESYSGSFSNAQPSISPTTDLETTMLNKPTTWYITKIELPSGKAITFKYNQNPNRKTCSVTRLSYEKQNYVDFHLNQVNQTNPTLAGDLLNAFSSLMNMGAVNPGDFLEDVSCQLNLNIDNFQYSASVSEDVCLDSIIFPNGCILFETSDRKDLRHLNYLSPQKIDKITVRDNYFNKTLKEVGFFYDYFNSDKENESDNWNFLRLKLDSIVTKNENKKFPAYKFDYYIDYRSKLPEKDSYAKDYWGYPNGNYTNDNNSSYGIPKMEINEIPSIEKSFTIEDANIESFIQNVAWDNLTVAYEGANRLCNPVSFKAALLKSIKYPMGNLKTFYYSPNSYSNFTPTEEFIDVQEVIGVCSGNNCVFSGTSDTVIIDIKYPTTVSVEGNLFKIQGTLNYSNGVVSIRVYNADGTSYSIGGWEGNGGTYNMSQSFQLNPGQNMIIMNLVTQEQDVQGMLTVKWEKTADNLVYIKQGGGARIAQIHNSENPEQDLYFDYSKKIFHNGKNQLVSTGKLLANPIGPYWRFHTGFCSNTLSKAFVALSLVRTSVPIGTLNDFNSGSPVAYDSVKVITGDSTLMGYTLFEYHNEEETPYIISQDIDDFKYYSSPYLPNIYKLNNGLLEKTSVFDNTGEIVKKSSYVWEKDNRYEGSVKGLKFLPGGSFGFYEYNYEWWTKIKEIEILRDKDSKEVEKIVEHLYNSSNYMDSVSTTTTSISGIQKTFFYYPQDYPSYFNVLKTNNMIGKPIDVRTYNNNQLISGLQKEYNDDGQTINIYKAEVDDNILDIEFDANNPYKFTHEFTVEYTSDKSLSQIVPNTNFRTSYVWSYNRTLPVVKADNISYASLEAAVIAATGGMSPETFWNSLSEMTESFQKNTWESFNNSLRSNSALKDAMITTYTYKPLVGMTSETDPAGHTTYYEYDDFGRLKLVRDQNGNIVKKHEYHYAGQN
nr:RHS repeat domain-containing protein [uncultured Draconibacterium sp.]